MGNELLLINDTIANTLIRDSSVMSYLIKKYFRENHNIDLGEFQNRQFVSKEVAALDISKSIVTDKYNFFCGALDYFNTRRVVYIDVYIKYTVLDNNDVDISVPVTINRFVMTYPVDKDDSIEISMVKKADIFSPLKAVGITKLSSTFEYSISAELDLSIDMKFIKKE